MYVSDYSLSPLFNELDQHLSKFLDKYTNWSAANIRHVSKHWIRFSAFSFHSQIEIRNWIIFFVHFKFNLFSFRVLYSSLLGFLLELYII